MLDLTVQNIGTDRNSTLVVDSRLIAEVLGVNHGAWMTNVLKKYQTEIEEDFGQFHFKNGTVVNSVGAVNTTVYALLTEDQSMCLMTYSKNTDQVRAAKRNLVKSFAKAKDLLQGGYREPEQKALPETSLERWTELIASLPGLASSPIVMAALRNRVSEELSGCRAATPIESPILLTVRANRLGCPNSAIGNGSKLGKYIIARGFRPLPEQELHGKYWVNVYNPSPELDDAIITYCNWGNQ